LESSVPVHDFRTTITNTPLPSLVENSSMEMSHVPVTEIFNVRMAASTVEMGSPTFSASISSTQQMRNTGESELVDNLHSGMGSLGAVVATPSEVTPAPVAASDVREKDQESKPRDAEEDVAVSHKSQNKPQQETGEAPCAYRDHSKADDAPCPSSDPAHESDVGEARLPPLHASDARSSASGVNSSGVQSAASSASCAKPKKKCCCF